MVNPSPYLLDGLRASYSDAGVNDLKSFYRGRRYIAEVLKCLPEKTVYFLFRPDSAGLSSRTDPSEAKPEVKPEAKQGM